MCDTLFHTRLEWDDHKLSSDHLRKVGEQRRQFNPDLKDDEFELLDVIIIEDEEEELPVASKIKMLEDQEVKDEEEDEQEEPAVKTETENNEDEEKMETGNEVDKETEVLDKETEVKEGENGTAKEETTVVKTEKEEKYNPANVVGRELVVKTGGYVCRLCSTFMKNDEEADLHCQTATHYINFTSITKLHVSKVIQIYLIMIRKHTFK